ncbi:MAG: serine/threonine-protein kinase, partial [Parvularculaceae bacterium]
MTFDPDVEKQALNLLTDALKKPAAQRQAFIRQQATNETIKTRALALLALDADEADALLTAGGVRAIDDLPAPDRIGPYRLTRKIGEGGMGMVYLGERDDDEFSQQVAIKLGRGYQLSDQMIERLKQERSTLAQLSHPNIAQLYDGGQTQEGAPYFIMEFVEGQTLNDYLKNDNLTLLVRLQIFEDILKAVAYAHRNLIIHRDLTPNNTMISDDGTVKLIDFGISHSLETGSDIDNAARRTMTKGYAAPEQARGEPTTTLSDIYSLGVLLHDLTKGTKVPRQDDIDAIIAKARADAPEQRYQTVEMISADIDRYKQRRSVVAHEGSVGYQLRRFMARNLLAVGASVIALTGLAVAIATITTLYFQAQTAEREASQRFEDVRSLSNTVLYDIYPEIEDLPGATAARRKLVEAAQSYLDKLAHDERASPALTLETGKGFTELASIMGSPSRSAFEETELSAQHFATATQLLHKLDNDEATPAALFALGNLHYGIADLEFGNDDDKALAEFTKAQAYLERGLVLAPDDPDLNLRHFSTRVSMADLSYHDDDQQGAREALRKIISDIQMSVHLDKENVEKYLLLNRSYRLLGLSLVNEEATRDQAPAQNKLALENILAAQVKMPKSNHINVEAAKSYRDLAFASYMNNSHEEAVIDYQRAIDILTKITSFDPDDQSSALTLIYYKGEITAPLSSLKRYKEAETLLLDVRSAYEQRLKDEPKNGKRMRNLWVHNYFLASHYKLREDTPRACKHIDEMGRFIEMMRAAGTLQELDENNWAGVIKSEYDFCQPSD